MKFMRSGFWFDSLDVSNSFQQIAYIGWDLRRFLRFESGVKFKSITLNLIYNESITSFDKKSI